MPIAHVFPDSVLLHVVTFNDRTRTTLGVAPSETFGHALRRAGFSPDDVSSVEVPDAPLSYEPDFASAVR